MRRLLNRHHPRHLLVLLPVAALAVLLLGTPATPGQPDKVKLPEPDKTALDKSEKILTKMFKEELAKAKTDGAAARELAQLLLKEARLTNEDAPLRFIALVYARDLAAQSGDTTTGMGAIEELSKHFAVDTLGMKTKMIGLAADKATSKDDHVSIVELALAMLDEAVASDNYKIVDDLIKAAEESATKTKNLQIVGRVSKRADEAEQAKKEFGRMQKFIDILATKADDPAANGEMGKYLCLVKGNWEKGLPLLAKGEDKAFRELAKRDIANPKETRAQLDIGDEYDSLAENEKGLTQKMLLKRAMHWYIKCQPHLEGGLNKVRVEKKIEEIAKLFPSAPGITVVAGSPITTLVRVFDQAHFNGVMMVAISDDNKLVVSCGNDENIVRLWNVADGKQIRQMAGHTGFIFAVAVSPDGSQVASASQDSTVRTWDTKTGNNIRSFTNHGDWVWGVYYFPDKQRILTSCDDKVLRIFDLNSGKVLKEMRGHTQYVPYMAATKDGKRAATASNDGTVRVWNLDQANEIAKFTPIQQPSAVAISPDGKKVVVASQANMSVKMWDVDANKEIRAFTVPAPAKAIAFSPDGKTVAVGTGGLVNTTPPVAVEGGWPAQGINDNSIYFFEAETGKPIRRLVGHTGWVRTLAYSNDGRYLVSGGADKMIRLWGDGKK